MLSLTCQRSSASPSRAQHALMSLRTLKMFVCLSLGWCFKSCQPQRIVSGLRETFIARHIVERTSKAEIRPEEQSEKAESCRESLWNEIQLKGP